MNCANENNIPASRPSGPRILIADEIAIEAISLESCLQNERLGQVRLTTDVREVSPLFDKWRFNLLILDMHNTLVDGVALIHQLAPPINAGELGVVALVNPGDEQTRMAALGAGATEALMRPFNRTIIMPCIRRALAQQASGLLEGVYAG